MRLTKRRPVPPLLPLLQTAFAGDIVAIGGLKDVVTGETLCCEKNPVILEKMDFPDPVIKVRFRAWGSRLSPPCLPGGERQHSTARAFPRAHTHTHAHGRGHTAGCHIPT